MKRCQGGQLARLARSGLWLCLFAGCATGRGRSDAVEASRNPAPPRGEMSEPDPVCCPDTIEVAISGAEPIRQKVSPDGRIDLGPLGRVRVEGLLPADAGRRIAEAAAVPPNAVQVRVAEHNSQQVFIFGKVNGLQRAVPYRGDETVHELLQRAGGLAAGAEPEDVYVVRAHVAEGGRPEVFPIHFDRDSKDRHGNLKVQPFDQVYIGETRQSSVWRSLPPVLRPLYESIWGMKRGEEKAAR